MTTPVPPRLAELALARSALDRAAHRRGETLIADLLADPATRVLTVTDGRAPVAGDPPALVLREPLAADRRRLGVFLGEDADAVAYVAVSGDLAADPTDAEAGGPASENPGPAAVDPGSSRWAGLREVGALLGARDVGLMTQALGLVNWHASHPRCPRCGEPTRVVQSGYARRCDADGSEHYPRTDPAVIMTVVDADDRLLLGRQSSWPVGRYSTLAGFVEPGEALEDAVRREVMEEVGVVVGEVAYLGSQPWPFPASVMVGFTARADSTDVQVDGVEIEQARWFTRAELADGLASGELLGPTRLSIARHLIEHWYGGSLDAEGTWR